MQPRQQKTQQLILCNWTNQEQKGQFIENVSLNRSFLNIKFMKYNIGNNKEGKRAGGELMEDSQKGFAPVSTAPAIRTVAAVSHHLHSA